MPGSGQVRPGAPLPAHSDGVVGSGQDRPGTPLPAHSDGVVGSGQERSATPPPAYSPDGVVGSGQDRPGEPLPAHSDGVVGSGQDRPGTPPPAYRPVAGGDQVPGVPGVGVPGNRPLEVPTSQTPGSPAVTPHASGAPVDTALRETGRSGSVVDSGSGVVPAGHGSSPGGWAGHDGHSGAEPVAAHGDSHVDSVAAHGDSHRQDGTAVSPDSTMVPVDGSQSAPPLHRDPAVVLPVGLPVDAVRVSVPANVVAGGGLAEYVRGGVTGSAGGPVVLMSQGNSTVGVVVSPGQGSDLARGLGRVVVALTPGSVGGTPQWTVFAADGSARPVTGSDAGVPVGGRGGLAGLAEASGGVPVGVPVGTAASGTAPVGQWSDSDMRGEIERARQLELTPGEMDAARRIVHGTHDIRKLAGRGAAVSVDDVVTLVAANYHKSGRDKQGQVMEFSQALAEKLGTGGSGLSIQAGAGPEDQAGRSGESVAGSGRYTGGGPLPSDAAVLVDDTVAGAVDQRGLAEQAAPIEVEIRERIAALRDALELLEAQKAELVAVQGRDEDRQALWEPERALQAELAVLQAELAKFVPEGIARLAELTGRMERHLRAMPPDFDPNGVRASVETAKSMVRQGDWTSEDLQYVEERLGGVEAAEGRLRNARRAKVQEVYVQAKQAIEQRRVPVTYFEDGVPGGVSSRSDVRLGFEVEFKLPGENFDARVHSLGVELEQAGLVDWRTAHGSKLVIKTAAEEILANRRWALLKEAERFEVEATSPILRNDTGRPVSEQVWPSMEKLLSAVKRQDGYGSESGGHINVSFDWQLTPVQYVRVAQVAKVFEAVLFRLGNVAGGEDSKQRDVRYARTLSLPSDPYTVDDGDTGYDGYESLPYFDDKFRAVRFDVVGFESDRLEFRVWAGDAGELTGNPALWQVRAELSAAIMLAGTDPGIYRELDRLMEDPDLLGYDDQTRHEGAWLEKLAEFLELLPLSEAAQAQAVQLFAWTRPWKLTGGVDDFPALVVSLPQQSVLFPAPGASKAQIVAKAYSYQLYKDVSLIVARTTPDRSGIRLRNGQQINFDGFARILNAYHVGRGWFENEGMWTVLAISRASDALLSKVLRVVNGPVLATTSDVYRTPDGRLLAGAYERQSDGRLRFRPTTQGWIEFTKNEDAPARRSAPRARGRFTGKFDLGEALMDSRTRLLPDAPAKGYRYWPARAVPLPAGLPVDAVRVSVPANEVAGGGLAEFVRGGVAGSTGGPVVLVSQGDPGVGVVVSSGQGSDLARGLGRVVVALTPGPVGGTPQWTVFAADGSARPVTGSDAEVLAGGRGG
ncbi:hypothetical protein ACWDKQ_35350, partial [Saccharopolyspora sp. NPDC000995]